MIYFTSDTHFGDARVLRIDRRPFANMVEHDAALIETWNDTIGPDDEVWHLGDVMSSRSTEDAELLLSRLNGRKHLVIGNNDPVPVTQAAAWASVQHYAEDNTYQPYNGPRRSCESPHMAGEIAPDTARAETVAYSTGAERPLVQADNSHVNWCLERYRSYRLEDNSYQPYNGPRRACESPFG